MAATPRLETAPSDANPHAAEISFPLKLQVFFFLVEDPFEAPHSPSSLLCRSWLVNQRDEKKKTPNENSRAVVSVDNAVDGLEEEDGMLMLSKLRDHVCNM